MNRKDKQNNILTEVQDEQREAMESDECVIEEEDDFFKEGKDSFLQPSSSRFTLRKRKRRGELNKEDRTDGDNVSVCSLELEADQPEHKKKKSLSKMSSLSNMLSLSKVSKMGSALHKSLSSSRFGSPMGSMRTPSSASLARSASTVFGDGGGAGAAGAGGGAGAGGSGGGGGGGGATGRKSPGSLSLGEGPQGWSNSPFRMSSVSLASRKSSQASLNLTPYKAPGPTPSKSRPTRYWSDKYKSVLDKLSPQEIKLQEAVFEIFNGEDDLVEDLKLIRKTYADSLIHLNILSPEEEQLVFGYMSALLPLHQAFHANLGRHQCKDGFWFEIGPAVEKWIRTIETAYVNYCSNLIEAKSFLDKKMAEDKSFSDFLQRCQESPFSRKLDLWAFLAVPRSRLVKYPLLLKQVLKYSENEDDIKIITECIARLEKIIEQVDDGMAEAKCRKSISTMEFMTAELPDCVSSAREEIMTGVLRNNRGTKVEVFLLDTALVVGREPLPTSQLVCQDLTDGETSQASGPVSFQRAFSYQSGSKNAFRVHVVGLETDKEAPDKTHILLAADEHTKKQWVSVIQKAILKSHLKAETNGPGKVTAGITLRSSPKRLNKVQQPLSGWEV